MLLHEPRCGFRSHDVATGANMWLLEWMYGSYGSAQDLKLANMKVELSLGKYKIFIYFLW